MRSFVTAVLPSAGAVLMLGTQLAQAAGYEPAQIDVGAGLGLVPQIAIKNGFDDNTANQSSNEIDSWFTVIKPRLTLEGGGDISHLAVTYELADGRYHSSDEDDFTDHKFITELHHEFTSKHRVDLDYRFSRVHEERGTGISEGQGESLTEVAEKDIHRADLVYGIGAAQARFNFDINVNYEDLAYRNYEQLTQYSDYDTIGGGATVYYRLGPDSSLLLDAQYAERSYDLLPPSGLSRDSSDQQLRLGFRWQATGVSAGTFKLGYAERDYDDAQRSDFSGLTWSLGAEWAPKTYSTFYIESGRRAKDPDTLGDYVRETTAQIRWEHGWTERFTTLASIAYQDEEYTGIERDDDALTGEIGARYHWRRWLNTDLSYQYIDQDSTFDALTYDKNIYWLTVTASL
ncbi:outer membrane beta-barrel protein [Neiella marina]|uniref:Outer membrane beta-barrel protein n=1 Tax=Neiella holothuriorum TaxID=2870530 RepID=A0ABS7ECX9_9GAMM|nr:outer membrane beta-barrel protein [Neiella holothuriorum]MBW8190168.1 outer membrane beta-barrel protein [Neiella holothuriorum]